MSDRLEHVPAQRVPPSWLGSRVTVQDVAGVERTGALSDVEAGDEQVFLFVGGRVIAVAPGATVSRGELPTV